MPQLSRGSMVHARLLPGRTSKAVRHRTVEELWFVLAGQGEMWRKQGAREEIVRLLPGVALSIPVGTIFQFRNTGTEPLDVVLVTMPPLAGSRGGSGRTRPLGGGLSLTPTRSWRRARATANRSRARPRSVARATSATVGTAPSLSLSRSRTRLPTDKSLPAGRLKMGDHRHTVCCRYATIAWVRRPEPKRQRPARRCSRLSSAPSAAPPRPGAQPPRATRGRSRPWPQPAPIPM